MSVIGSQLEGAVRCGSDAWNDDLKLKIIYIHISYIRTQVTVQIERFYVLRTNAHPPPVKAFFVSYAQNLVFGRYGEDSCFISNSLRTYEKA